MQRVIATDWTTTEAIRGPMGNVTRKTLPKDRFRGLPVGSLIDGLPSGKRYVEQEFVLTL